MLKVRFRAPLASWLVLAMVGPLAAQDAGKTPELPVTRVVLFSSGVGYFQRDGEINGKAAVALHFNTEQINDLLKSLIIRNGGAGHVNLVQYENRNPIDRTLKAFALDLSGDPSLGKLLTQARGERVRITLPQENGGNPLEGVIVGVERKKELVGKDQLLEVEQLNLLTDKGIISRPLARVERLEFVKPALKEELRKALETLAAGRDRQKKSVTLQFSGVGKRTVSVGYLVESPVWKTTYRLSLNDGKLALQGWAIVENTTDEDWKNVRVGLVEGRPISFRMDLYEPLFVPRPFAQLERFAGLMPQSYAGEMALSKAKEPLVLKDVDPAANDFDKKIKYNLERIEDSTGKGGEKKYKNGPSAGPVFNAPQLPTPPPALTQQLGEFFQYEIKEPISVARQQSALLPILDGPIQGKRVSIYNDRVQVKHPLLGLLLKNSTKLHLMQGPITVYEENSYAGDALLPDVRPGEERLISYAVDLGTEVIPSTDAQHPVTENLVSIKITQGILHATYKQRQTRTYTIVNRNDEARDVLIEHAKQAGWKVVLKEKEKAPKETRDVYRFAVAVPKQKTAVLEVKQEAVRLDQVVLTNSADETLRYYLTQTNPTQEVLRKELTKAIALKAAWTETQRALEQERAALANLDKNEARLRENLKVLEKTSDLYKATMKRFETMENEFVQREAKANQLQTQVNQQRSEYEKFVRELKVE